MQMSNTRLRAMDSRERVQKGHLSTVHRQPARSISASVGVPVKCPRCGEKNPDEAKFCLACAAPIALVCRRCGTRLPSSAKYCFECAHPVTAAEAPIGTDGDSRKLRLREARISFEREFILAELRTQGWNMTRAAEELGIERSHLYRKVREYGIMPDS